jgi:hypothetical protein
LICAVIERGEDVWIPGAYEAAEVLAKAQLAGPWLDPPITLAWGPFFAPSLAEQQQRTSTAVDAEREGLITASTATRAVADIFDIEDPEAERAAIEKASAERAERGKALFGEKPDGAPVDPNEPAEPADEISNDEGAPDTAPTKPAPIARAAPDPKPEPKPAADAAAPAADPKVNIADLQINAFDYDAGIITVNEARKLKFQGALPPIDGGDVSVLEWKTKIEADNKPAVDTVVVHKTEPKE